MYMNYQKHLADLLQNPDIWMNNEKNMVGVLNSLIDACNDLYNKLNYQQQTITNEKYNNTNLEHFTIPTESYLLLLPYNFLHDFEKKKKFYLDKMNLLKQKYKYIANLLLNVDTKITSTGFNSTGFNSTGFNSTGFNSTGFNSTGFNSTGFNSLPTKITDLITKIQDNFNPYTKTNKLYENVYKNSWNDTLANIQKSDNFNIFIDPNEFNSNDISFKTDNILNFIRNQSGGNNLSSIYNKLGIKIVEVHKSTRSSNKYISTSLFDKGLTNKPGEYKNIKHYCVNLYESIKLYNKYLPDYNIRIYGDMSINVNNNPDDDIKKLLELINNSNNVDYYEVTQSFNGVAALEPNQKNHIGLYGALFRFYTLLDPIISHCIFVDADNFPMETFTNIIKNWENNKESNLLIFKPLFYQRKNINDKCIDQMLAGMSGFKKETGKILNPLVFVRMFEYMDKQYNKFKDEFIDECDGNNKIKYTTPFRFGFEEQALTNILIPFYILNNIKLIIIPMYFDFGSGFQFYYNEILNSLTNDYLKIIDKNLGLNKDTVPLVCFVDPLYGFNIHIGVILINFLDKCLSNNVNKINGIKIIQDNKIEFLKRHLSIKGFYHLYPAFNLSIPIDEINKYVDVLFNGNQISPLKLKTLTKEALHEFGSDTEKVYGRYSDNINLQEFFKNPENQTLNVLKSSDLYKIKYEKYKMKYLTLKKMYKL